MSVEQPHAVAAELPTAYKHDVFSQSCWDCGSVVTRPAGEEGPIFCQRECERRWRRDVVQE